MKGLICLFDVEYYEKDDGTYPAEEFILSQDMKMHKEMKMKPTAVSGKKVKLFCMSRSLFVKVFALRMMISK